MFVAWNEWKQQHNKEYPTEFENDRRKHIWTLNHDFIYRHNIEFDQEKHSFNVGHNKYSDLTSQEFLDSLTGFDAEQHAKRRDDKKDCVLLNGQVVASSVDWRPLGCLNPIQDQNRVKASYVYSAASAIESQYFLRSGHLVKLSEQLIDEASYATDLGNGGTMNNGSLNNYFECLTKKIFFSKKSH